MLDRQPKQKGGTTGVHTWPVRLGTASPNIAPDAVRFEGTEVPYGWVGGEFLMSVPIELQYRATCSRSTGDRCW